MTSACVNGCNRLIEIGARVAERHAVAAAHEPRNQVQRAINLRCKRDDTDVGRSRLEDTENVVAAELPVAALMVRQTQTH